MSGCHCGQAGSMFCDSCSDLECRESMEYYREDIEKQKALEKQKAPERQKEEKDWDEFHKNMKKEKEEFLNLLYNLYEESD